MSEDHVVVIAVAEQVLRVRVVEVGAAEEVAKSTNPRPCPPRGVEPRADSVCVFAAVAAHGVDALLAAGGAGDGLDDVEHAAAG